ncbi:cyclic nucleotide-binding domain-containing protein [Limnobacter parvus]|uniref:Cyclic nucleotide-binding domain-containing protein n=1 Tax=Limnobacter parvus TaxID=2939690 RepID=A0ABT1XMB9_9BURK|nr:cyclic nucleotide-binding domain-containing protein [Limnobacter parvus]MCR2747407.1 cyclic nucleotide-binding domain-containing protein [Limnobacter parvus]
MNTELKAGALVAFGGYAQAIVYGMLAFAPLGQAGLAYGIYAGLASALLGSAVGALGGKAPVQFGGPRSSTALIVAGSLLGFLQITDNHTELMLLLALEVSLAGLFIALAQRQGVGKLMQFLPAPVLIGMNTTLGVFSAYKLLPAIVGFAVFTGFLEAFSEPGPFSLVALGVSAITVGVLLYFRAIRPNPLGLMYGLAAGFGLHLVLLWAWPGDLPVQTVAAWPVHPFLNTTAQQVSGAAQQLPALFLDRPELLLQLVAGSAVLALMVVLESMQSLLQVDQTLGTRHNTRRELNVLACANMLCGLFLALPTSNYFSRSNTGLSVGSKNRRSEAWYMLSLSALLLLTWPVLEHLPLHILATAVAVTSLLLIQPSTVRLVRQFFRPRQRKKMLPTDRFTVWVVLSMIAVTGLSNLLIGTLVGVLFVAAYFLQQQSSSGLRSIEYAPAARSRSMRPRAQRQHLQTAFEHLAWVRFEGNLFFGNAPSIAIVLQDELTKAQSIILDFSHLGYIDDTACDCIERLINNAPTSLAVVAVMPNTSNPNQGGADLLRKVLEKFNVPVQAHIDEAFWWIENQLLGTAVHNIAPANTEQALVQSHLCDDMNPEQTRQFTRFWECTQVAAGQELFREGDDPCGLYVLLQGQLSAWQHTGNTSERLMRFCPGSLVGEMALIDNKPRSATVRADSECSLLFLPARHFEELRHEHAELGRVMLNNLARELALRIRLANQSLAMMQ